MKEIKENVFLHTKEELELELKRQVGKPMSDDSLKFILEHLLFYIDFTEYNFWVTTDDGQTPQGFNKKEDAMDWILNNC